MKYTMTQPGVWPVMLTAFTPSGEVDYRGCERLVDWYLANRVSGIFAVCLSSEMFDLSAEERAAIARLTVKRAAGAVPVVACAGFGHTEEERFCSICEMAAAGVDTVVLPLSSIFPESFTDRQVRDGLLRIFADHPDVSFGVYECPVPYKRLLPPALLGELARAADGQLRFLKDTCCDREQLRAKAAAVAGTSLKIYNAHLTTLTDSVRVGCSGFSGIAANFFPDALAEQARVFFENPEKTDEMQIIFNTLERNAELHYPRGAKEFLRQQGLPITDFCRVPRPDCSADDRELLRDFGRFVELWKRTGYEISTQREVLA